jgi:hypothetical protein
MNINQLIVRLNFLAGLLSLEKYGTLKYFWVF